MLEYKSTKTYGHDVGLSCALRNWRARDSHCRFLHGYSLYVDIVFVADTLDERGWVVDFGSLKSLKGWLQDNFDHKTIVAADDPALGTFRKLHEDGLIQLNVLPAVGCEAFAEMIFLSTAVWLEDNGYAPRVRVRSVEVREHGANSAIFEGNLR